MNLRVIDKKEIKQPESLCNFRSQAVNVCLRDRAYFRTKIKQVTSLQSLDVLFFHFMSFGQFLHFQGLFYGFLQRGQGSDQFLQII